MTEPSRRRSSRPRPVVTENDQVATFLARMVADLLRWVIDLQFEVRLHAPCAVHWLNAFSSPSWLRDCSNTASISTSSPN